MTTPVRVAFLTTHPIQYQVPVFRLLDREEELDFRVYYCMLPDAQKQGEGFGVQFSWDIPLLDGYRYSVLNNVSKTPSVTSFKGCETPEIRSVLQRDEIDVLIVNGWVVKSCLQGLRAARSLRIPCIVRGEANNLRHRPRWKRMLQRVLVRRYSACLPIGRANRDFYLSHGVNENRLFPAPYCVENERFAAAVRSPEPGREVRQKHGIPEDATCFLFSGKLQEKKHPIELIKAFCVARKAHPKMHLLIVGDGEQRQECEAIARRGNVPVHFAGFVNQQEIPAYYSAADCLVLPSDAGETWGLVVNEGMACGRPAIVSDLVGCSADLITQGETGWTFPFGNWNALADLFIEAARDPAKLHSMGQNARARIDSYSPQQAADGIIQAVTALHLRSKPRQRKTIATQ